MKYTKTWKKIEDLLEANGFDDLSQLQSLQITGGNLTIEWNNIANVPQKECNRIRIIDFLYKALAVGEEYKGEAYCVYCKEKRAFVGDIKVSETGRRMAQGVCPECGTKVNRIFGKA